MTTDKHVETQNLENLGGEKQGAAEIKEMLADCAVDRHRWEYPKVASIRAEKTCIVCKITLNDAQIALLKPEPRTTNLRLSVSLSRGLKCS